MNLTLETQPHHITQEPQPWLPGDVAAIVRLLSLMEARVQYQHPAPTAELDLDPWAEGRNSYGELRVIIE